MSWHVAGGCSPCWHRHAVKSKFLSLSLKRESRPVSQLRVQDHRFRCFLPKRGGVGRGAARFEPFYQRALVGHRLDEVEEVGADLKEEISQLIAVRPGTRRAHQPRSRLGQQRLRGSQGLRLYGAAPMTEGKNGMREERMLLYLRSGFVTQRLGRLVVPLLRLRRIRFGRIGNDGDPAVFF